MTKTNATATNCAHYWVIDSPNGITSTGRCKRCGLVKEFYNDFDSSVAPDSGHSEKQRAAAHH